MTVQLGLCQTWSEPQIVGFLMHRLSCNSLTILIRTELSTFAEKIFYFDLVLPDNVHVSVFEIYGPCKLFMHVLMAVYKRFKDYFHKKIFRSY